MVGILPRAQEYIRPFVELGHAGSTLLDGLAGPLRYGDESLQRLSGDARDLANGLFDAMHEMPRHLVDPLAARNMVIDAGDYASNVSFLAGQLDAAAGAGSVTPARLLDVGGAIDDVQHVVAYSAAFADVLRGARAPGVLQHAEMGNYLDQARRGLAAAT